jgi:putative ABC transport system permease protein
MALDGLRIAARTLRRQPVFTSVVVLSLALGIALNTTMYGVLDALMKPRIDMRAPERLYWIRLYGDYKHRADDRARDAAIASGMHTYESITRLRFEFGGRVLEHGENIREASVAGVGTNFFDVTGARPIAGRTFIPSDEQADVKPVVVSDQLVSTLFRPGESPIGARIKINREARIIVGVVPSTANFPHDHYWAWEVAPVNPPSMYVRLIRLREGASSAGAAHELDLVATRIAAAAGEDPRDVAFRFHQAADPEFQVRAIEIALVLAVAAVLLVACANLANIQLARGIGRRRELALRSALGATRRRVVAHLLTESVLLAAIGLLLGLVLTYWASRALNGSIPPQVGTYIVEPQFSWRVLAFAVSATVLCVILVGLLPAIAVSRADPNELLKSGAGTGTTRSNRRVYGVLVGSEIALALALSSGAAVLIRSQMLTSSFRYSFNPGPIAIGNVSLRLPVGTARFSDVLQSVVGRLAAVPNLSTAAGSMSLAVENGAISLEDAGAVREFPAPLFAATVVSPLYLRTLGPQIVKGRDFLQGERDHAAVIVDERTATALWPNANPIGAVIKLGDERSARPYVRVVGVVNDLEKRAGNSLAEAQPRGVKALGRIYYLPGPIDEFAIKACCVSNVQIIARAKTRPEKLPLAVRREISGWPDALLSQISTWDDHWGMRTAREGSRFVTSLFTLFAALGVGLAAFGVYGVVAHSVAERRRELGVRVALGATSRDILHAVLRAEVVVALGGVAFGLFLTKFCVRLLPAFEDEFFNAPLFALVAALLIATVAASAFIPALRATRIDATESLRHE